MARVWHREFLFQAAAYDVAKRYAGVLVEPARDAVANFERYLWVDEVGRAHLDGSSTGHEKFDCVFGC